jgi:RND family efflux transporter MFP subunit
VKHSPAFRVVVSSVLAFLPCAVACTRGADAAGTPPTAQHAPLEPESATVFGERLLLFLEYPPLVRGAEARFLAHLSVLADGEPVRAGRVTLHIGTQALGIDVPKREGLFVPAGALQETGRLRARLEVASEQATETLDIGEVIVHASEADARAAAAADTESEPANAVPFLMEQQWKVKLLLVPAAPRQIARQLVLAGKSRVPEGAEAVIAAPVAGRLVTPDKRKLPASGERVEAGQLLGFVEPPLGAPELAQLHALQLEFELRQLDVARALTEAETRAQFAEREHARIAELRQNGLSTAQQLEAAERDLAVSRSDLGAAQASKAALAALAKRRGADPETSAALRLPVTAPITGSVLSMSAVTGASVTGGEELLHVADLSRLWIEARLSEFDLPRLRDSAQASVTFAGLPGKRFELVGSPYIAPLVDTATRTLLVRYELPNADGGVRAGMLAEVAITTERTEAPVAIPLAAIVSEQGRATAYVMLEGELFQKRELSLGIRDESYVEITSGLAAGERVATRGANSVRLAALSPASFGAGHAH